MRLAIIRWVFGFFPWINNAAVSDLMLIFNPSPSFAQTNKKDVSVLVWPSRCRDIRIELNCAFMCEWSVLMLCNSLIVFRIVSLTSKYSHLTSLVCWYSRWIQTYWCYRNNNTCSLSLERFTHHSDLKLTCVLGSFRVRKHAMLSVSVSNVKFWKNTCPHVLF